MIGLTWDELPRNDTDYLFCLDFERIRRSNWLTRQGYPQNIQGTSAVAARERIGATDKAATGILVFAGEGGPDGL
jgi:hypothetical protein